MSQQKHLGKRCHQEYPGASTKQEYVRGKRPSTVRNIKKKSEKGRKKKQDRLKRERHFN